MNDCDFNLINHPQTAIPIRCNSGSVAPHNLFHHWRARETDSGKSALSVWHDDDESDIYFCYSL